MIKCAAMDLEQQGVAISTYFMLHFAPYLKQCNNLHS